MAGVAALYAGEKLGSKRDCQAMVSESIRNYERDWREAMRWSYRQTDLEKTDGTEQTEVSEVSPLGGAPYGRLILKNGQKLTSAEQEKEVRKFRRAEEKRRSETPGERDLRLTKYEKERAFVDEIPKAYQFTLVGEESIEGRPAWVVTLRPRPDFVPTAPHAGMLKHIEGKLWIDKEDLRWARAEAHVIDTIGIGLILARIGPGAHITVDQMKVDGHLWVPRRISIVGDARVLLVHDKVLNEVLTFSDYRKDAFDPLSSGPASTPKLPEAKTYR